MRIGIGVSEQLGIEFSGRALKEEGMARTLEAEHDAWITAALFALRHFAIARGEFKTEDFRDWYTEAPHDHHVWGALTNRACKAGIIAWTGKFAPSESPRTHGHHVKVWRAA